MPDNNKFSSNILWGAGALVAGALIVGVPFLAWNGFSFSWLLPSSVSSFGSEQPPGDSADPSAKADDGGFISGRTLGSFFASEKEDTYQTRTLSAASYEIPKEGPALVADLGEMMIRLYQDGVMQKEYPILSKGKPGSLWETPTGVYKVKTKEENHFSSIGSVWMPYSMQFFGNFFIHGWPHHADGSPVPVGYSGGCIRLSDESAKDIFLNVSLGTPVIVVHGVEPADAAKKAGEAQLHYLTRDPFTRPPNITAESAMVGDLENGFVFYEKNSSDRRSIASVSKLMTGLISLEAVNQFRTITVSSDDVAIEGDAGNLKAGEPYELQELMWPLLLSSSNDAAYTISRSIGQKHFVSLMNEKAASLGLKDTYFAEPSGLDPKNQSTSIDLFRLSQYLWSSKRSLLDITKNRNYKQWRNIHPFAAKSSFLGGKVGFIPESKKTAIAVFFIPFGEFAERPVAVVILGSDDIRADVERLRVWAKSNFYYGTAPIEEKKPMLAKNKGKEPFSLLFVGDIMMNRGVEQIIQREAQGDWNFPFMHIADELGDADVTFANLEGPASDKGADRHNLYSFRMEPDVISALKRAGVDLVSLANNHIGDWGREAMEDTMRRLLRAGIQYTGAGWNKKEALTPVIFDVKGKRIGYLGFSDVGPQNSAAGEALSGIALADTAVVETAVKEAKELADIIVVSFHFGDEYKLNPSNRQKTLARAAIDAGAKVVVGHHPHVVQPIAEYNGGVILYSLGNFIFDQPFSEDTMEGMMAKIEFEGDNITAIIPMPVDLNKFYQPSVRQTTGGGGN